LRSPRSSWFFIKNHSPRVYHETL